MIDKKELLRQVWENYSFDEIIDAGFDCGKCSGSHLVDAADEFKHKDKRPEDNCIDDLKEVLESYDKSDLPNGYDIMELMCDYFYETSLMDYFDNDDLIDHLDGTWEMDDYLKEKQLDSNDEEIEEYTFKDFFAEVDNMPGYNFKRLMCDWLNLNYLSTNNEILEKFNERIS